MVAIALICVLATTAQPLEKVNHILGGVDVLKDKVSKFWQDPTTKNYLIRVYRDDFNEVFLTSDKAAADKFGKLAGVTLERHSFPSKDGNGINLGDLTFQVVSKSGVASETTGDEKGGNQTMVFTNGEETLTNRYYFKKFHVVVMQLEYSG